MHHDPFTLVAALDDKSSARGSLYVDDYSSYEYITQGRFLLRSFAIEKRGTSLVFTSTYAHPAVRGEGCFVYDMDGRRYYDCLSAYSAVNQGHCHPRIMKAAIEQSQRLTLTSRRIPDNGKPGAYRNAQSRIWF